MASLNKIYLSGLLKDQIKIIESNYGNFGTFTLIATEEWYDSSTKSKKEKTHEFNIVVFNEDAINILSHASKMDSIVLEGQLKSKTFTNSKGYESTILEVVIPKFNGFLMVKSSHSNSTLNKNYTEDNRRSSNVKDNQRIASSFNIDDDIPF